MITEMNKSKTFIKHISCNYRFKLILEHVIQTKSLIMITVMSVKAPIKHHVYNGDYVPNSNTCVCKCDKDDEVDEYLKKMHKSKKYYWWFSNYMWWNCGYARDCVNKFWW